jgi:hypothetical protein
MTELIKQLQTEYPRLTFTAGKAFYWSPKTQTITYTARASSKVAVWSLLHELGHALLGHDSYTSDLELLLLEVAAWETASELAKRYNHQIDDDHIQDCLDTYRDWLHQRSTCPTCGNQSLQQDAEHYRCFNCRTTWKVTASRFCRPYRRVAPTTKTSPTSVLKQAMFR